MFESPVFVAHDWIQDTVRGRVKNKFSREEQKAIAQNRLDQLDRNVRNTHLKGNDHEIVEYVGLASQSVFDEHGNLLNEFKAPPESFKEDYRRSRGHSVARVYDIVKSGNEPLLRTDIVPRVIKESPRIAEILAKKKLSANAEKILRRTNYIQPYYLKEPENTDDDWLRKGLRLRSIQILANVLQFAVLRKDYAMARKVYPVLVRIHFVDPRAMWSIGAEILRQPGKRSSQQKDKQLYEWLLTAYPSITVRRPKWKLFPRALQIFPYYMLSLLAQGKGDEAREQLQNALTESPYSADPTCFAVYGLALMDAGQMDNARKQFLICQRLGGDVAGILRRFADEEATVAESASESDSDSADSDSPDSSDSEPPSSPVGPKTASESAASGSAASSGSASSNSAGSGSAGSGSAGSGSAGSGSAGSTLSVQLPQGESDSEMASDASHGASIPASSVAPASRKRKRRT